MGRLSQTAVLLTVAALVLVGGGAYALAASSPSTGKITACVSHKGGTLYQAKTCAKHNKELSWNTRGPQGPRGATGAAGAIGPPGLQGAKGDAGAPGPAGTARAYALVTSAGGLFAGHDHNVAAVATINAAPGWYCVELDPSVSNSSTAAIVSPWYQYDGTDAVRFTHVEFVGPCGSNGMLVYTYEVTQGASTLSVTPTDEGFFIAVP
jgi:hypothetical protein